MLLTRLTDLRHRGQRTDRADRERGSALASVVAVLAITGIVAASLLSATMFGLGTSSGTRAHVQSLTAAEGGLDAAKATLRACGADPVTSPAGTSPRYSVDIWHRPTETATWQRGCPAADSVQVKLVSTGTADATAIDGQVGKNTSTMESVVRQVPVVFAGRDLSLHSPLTAGLAGRADVVVNRDYKCVGSASLTHTGIFFLGATAQASGSCLTQGSTRTGTTYDETAPVNAFPRYTAADPRFSHLGPAVKWFDVPNPTNPGQFPPCTLTGSGTGVYTITGAGKLDTQTNCPTGLTVDSSWTLEFVLHGDVAVFVESLTLLGKLKIRSGDGKEHTLSIIRPWSPTQTCTGVADIRLRYGTVEQSLDLTRLMLYSSNTVHLGHDSASAAAGRPSHSLRGQVYGCDVEIWDPTTITYAAAGGTVTPQPWSAVELLSKRDEAG